MGPLERLEETLRLAGVPVSVEGASRSVTLRTGRVLRFSRTRASGLVHVDVLISGDLDAVTEMTPERAAAVILRQL